MNYASSVWRKIFSYVHISKRFEKYSFLEKTSSLKITKIICLKKVRKTSDNTSYYSQNHSTNQIVCAHTQTHPNAPTTTNTPHFHDFYPHPPLPNHPITPTDPYLITLPLSLCHLPQLFCPSPPPLWYEELYPYLFLLFLLIRYICKYFNLITFF